MNTKLRPVAIALVVLTVAAFLPLAVLAGPKTSPSTSSTSRSSTTSSSGRTWGSGGSSSSSSSTTTTSAPRTSSWGNSTTTSRAADGTITGADSALAAKARQTGATGKSRSDAFPQSSPDADLAPATTATNPGGGSYPVPQTYNYNPSTGPHVPPVVIYNNNPGYNPGYNNNGVRTGYYGPGVAAASTGSSHGFLGVLVVLIMLAVIAFVAYYMIQSYLTSQKALAAGVGGTAGGAISDSIGGVALNQPHSEGTSFDPHLSGDWSRVNPGALITLSDELTGLTGKEFTVSRVGTLTELDGLARWEIFHFEGEPNLRLLVTTVDKEISMYRLEATDVEPNTRQGLLDQNLSVFFMKPADENNFTPADLRYTAQFDDWESADKKHTTTYVQKGQGEMHGEYVQRPVPSGVTGALDGTIVEYAMAAGPNADTDHPYLVILETGELVETFLGSKPLRFSEIRVENV